MRRQLNAACVVVVCCGLVSCQESEVPETTNVTDERANRQFGGAWSLKSIERRGADGELAGAPIQDRVGYLIYDAAGYMGVTLMRPDRVPYAGDEPTVAEALDQLGSYTSYFGRFTVDEIGGFVTHHLEGSLNQR